MYGSVLLLIILFSLATDSFRFSKVVLDDDDKDRPAASTGHSLVARRNSLWLFGGIIEWYAKQGEKGKQEAKQMQTSSFATPTLHHVISLFCTAVCSIVYIYTVSSTCNM